MFEATFTITAQVESDVQGQHVYRVWKHADPINDDGLLSLLLKIYEQDVLTTLQVGDDLRVYVHLDLPPREIEKILHFREDGRFGLREKAWSSLAGTCVRSSHRCLSTIALMCNQGMCSLYRCKCSGINRSTEGEQVGPFSF